MRNFHRILVLKFHFHRFGGQEGVHYDGLIHFFTSMMIQALNLCGSIGEYHSYNLLQVILAGLKEGVHKEYRSSVVILFASLVPRVTFNAKVTKKILKSLNKLESVDVETLSMLALLFRCQSEQADDQAVLSGILKHKSVLSEDIFFNVSKQVDDDQEFAKRLLKALALLCSKLLPSKATPEIADFLSIVDGALGECLPTSETAEILISVISKTLVQYKAKKKQSSEPEESLKRSILCCKNILDTLRNAFVEEFARKSAIRHQKDVLFIEGIDSPTPAMVLAKKILLDNETVIGLLEEIKDQEPNIKSNVSALRSVLEAPDDFLANQMSGAQLASLCLNTLKLLPSKFKVCKLAMKHLLALEDNKSAIEFHSKHSVSQAALMLRMMFNPAERHRQHLQKTVEEFSSKKSDGLVAKLLPTWNVASSEDKKTLNKRLYAKLSATLTGTEICKLSEMILKSPVHRCEEMFTLSILLLSDALKLEKQEEISMQLIKMMLFATKLFPIRKPKKEKSESYKQILFSIESGAISSIALQSAIQSLIQVGEEQKVLLAMMGAIWQLRSVDPMLIETLLNGMKAMKDYDEFASAMLSMPVDDIFAVFAEEDKKSIMKHMHLHALSHIRSSFDENADLVKKAMSFDSPIIPGLFGGLWSDSKKVRKKILSCMEVAMQKPVSRSNYATFVRALITSKAAIADTPDNIKSVILSFKEECRSSQNTFEALLDGCLGCNEMLSRLAPIMPMLESKGLVQLAQHSTELLATYSGDKIKKSAFEAILVHLIAPFLEHIDEPSIWEFLSAGVSKTDGEPIFYQECEMSPSCAIIDAMTTGLKLIKKLDSKRGEQLFDLLVNMSGNVTDAAQLASSRNLLLALLPMLENSSVFATFKNIWGEGVFKPIISQKTPLKKRKPLPIDNSVPEPEKWHKTNFFLEVLSTTSISSEFVGPLSTLLGKALAQQDQIDHNYTMDLLISTLLSIVDKLTAEQKEQLPLDSELVIRCIRTCLNPDTKAVALMLLAKSTASSNAEYILHNSIQLFTFVGTHFLQMESRSNFEIACTAIDVLVPHILSACNDAKGGKNEVREMSVNILNTFVDASSDMPRHRFCIFMHRLVQRLGAKDYLWLLTLLLIKADLRKKHYDNMGGQKSSKLTTEERLQQLGDFYATFDDQISLQIHSVKQMIQFTSKNNHQSRKLLGITQTSNKLSVEDHFDMVRIKMLSFANNLTSSKVFLRRLIEELQSNALDQELKRLLEVLVTAMDALKDEDETEEEVENEKKVKIRRHLVVCYEKVFESVLSVLPTDLFLKMSRQLMSKGQPSNIQRKALEVLNTRFSQADQQTEILVGESDLTDVVQALSNLALSGDNAVNQQLALMCIKHLAKLSSDLSNPLSSALKELVPKLANPSFLDSPKPEPVVAAALLCITELLQSLGPQAVVFLAPFVKWLLTFMSEERLQSLVIFNSTVVSLQKTLDSFAGFLSPFFQKMVVAACKLTAWHHNREDESSLEFRHCTHRIKQLHLALSRGIPYYNLLNIAKHCYEELKNEKMESITALSYILQESLADVKKSDILSSSSLAMDFFVHVFKHRQHQDQDAHAIEESFGETFLSFGLKMALDDFKPVYYRLFNLALDVANSAYVATVFHITTMVAKKLKSLFSFVCEMVVQKATSIMVEMSKDKENEQNICAVGYALEALASIFAFNRVDSLLMKSYEDHVNAILEFMDGKCLDDDFLDKMKLCLGQLAATTDDETQWKYLNYQVLMLIRNKSPKVIFDFITS